MKKSNFLGTDVPVEYRGMKPDFSQASSDDFERLVFAPDPATGNPCSNLAYMAKGDDEVSRYIREHYLGNDSGTGTDGLVDSTDADGAIELCPDLGESRENYLKRVTELIAKQMSVNED